MRVAADEVLKGDELLERVVQARAKLKRRALLNERSNEVGEARDLLPESNYLLVSGSQGGFQR